MKNFKFLITIIVAFFVTLNFAIAQEWKKVETIYDVNSKATIYESRISNNYEMIVENYIKQTSYQCRLHEYMGTCNVLVHAKLNVYNFNEKSSVIEFIAENLIKYGIKMTAAYKYSKRFSNLFWLAIRPAKLYGPGLNNNIKTNTYRNSNNRRYAPSQRHFGHAPSQRHFGID